MPDQTTPSDGPETHELMDTPARIVDAAIALFNDRGTATVSTNHIAAACAMSPGNLYYHFRNKDEIIRAAYERTVLEEDELWLAAGHAETPQAMAPFLRSLLAIRARYPFFRLEMPELVSRDPELAAHYRDVQAGRAGVYRMLVESWLADDARALDDDEVDRLVDETWLILGAWYAHLAASGERIDDESIVRGADLVADIIARARPGEPMKQDVTRTTSETSKDGDERVPAKKDKKGKKHKKSKKKR